MHFRKSHISEKLLLRKFIIFWMHFISMPWVVWRTIFHGISAAIKKKSRQIAIVCITLRCVSLFFLTQRPYAQPSRRSTLEWSQSLLEVVLYYTVRAPLYRDGYNFKNQTLFHSQIWKTYIFPELISSFYFLFSTFIIR